MENSGLPPKLFYRSNPPYIGIQCDKCFKEFGFTFGCALILEQDDPVFNTTLKLLMNKYEKHECKLGCVMDWPTNWRELCDKMPRCDRCKTIYADKLYCLSERHPDVLVCRKCSDDYHQHIQDFVDNIKKPYRLDQTCHHCLNPESIMTPETCCTGCSRLQK